MRVVPVEYLPGGTWGQCQRCGFKLRLNEMRLEWSGLRVCEECWDPRPDQLSPPVVYPEGLPRPDAAPEFPDVFVGDVTPEDL
jgi:hypothetical protein